MKEHSYSPGSVDYTGNGMRNNLVVVTWEIKDGEFSMCGEVWNARHTDIEGGGQNLEEIAAMFPHDKKLQRMVEIWRRWHLNQMNAGTPAQEAFLREIKGQFPGYPADWLQWARSRLYVAILEPDNGYSYGSAWLREELPEDVRREIESWSEGED